MAAAIHGEYQATRAYKDTVFRRLFGDERSKANAVSLYNALGGSCADPDELSFTTIDGVIYLGRKNDVSFLVDGELMLWEHQSARNPNMPLRGLFHLAQLYGKHLDLYGLSIYSTKRLSLPCPHYYVFYAGEAEAPDREELRLSDSFEHGGEGACAEVTATVLNINEGHNAGLLAACETLAGYAHFVALARSARLSGRTRADAVNYAVETCIGEGVLAEFFRQNRAEVVAMFLEEWDEEKYRDLLRREAHEDGYAEGREAGELEGRAEGIEQGIEQGIELGTERANDSFLARAAEQVRSGALSLDDAARIFGFAPGKLQERLDSLV